MPNARSIAVAGMAVALATTALFVVVSALMLLTQMLKWPERLSAGGAAA